MPPTQSEFTFEHNEGIAAESNFDGISMCHEDAWITTGQ